MNSVSYENETNARIELEHIQLELWNGRTRHFRHFVDQYYCYKHGYVKGTGTPDWEKIVWKDGSVSREARRLNDRKLVVKEHVVPLLVISKMLTALSQKATLDEIAKVLDENVRFATITKEEDSLLRRSGLTSKMPKGFYISDDELWGDLLARYKSVGIVMVTPNCALKPTAGDY
ncbi:MAG: hypothetical protein HOO92_02065 [Methylococcaceae bacterium]|nr:hypothetical protein [Methylococcaceae bacterium]